MTPQSLFASLALLLSFASPALADSPVVTADDANFMDSFDPSAPGAEQVLDFYDRYQWLETGVNPDTSGDLPNLRQNAGPDCYRKSCRVFAHVKKSEQRLYLYVDGRLEAIWPTSTGIAGRSTPNFDKHPDGRIYNRYTSTKYPGGDFNGLGNMPYAVFIRGGYAIHGTGRGNWKRLGRPASHGCIRIHPNNAYVFNTFVRSVGARNTWITVN